MILEQFEVSSYSSTCCTYPPMTVRIVIPSHYPHVISVIPCKSGQTLLEMLMIDSRSIRSVSRRSDANQPVEVKNLAPHFLLIVTQFIFSGWHLLGFLVMSSGANPLIFALYRETIAAVLMLIYVAFRISGNYRMVLVDYVDYRRFIFVGFCSFVNVVGTVISLQYISPNRYAILQPAIPIIATAISCGIKLEKFTAMKTLGISVAALGAIITDAHSVGENNKIFEKNVRLGTIIVIIQCFFAANMIVFQKNLLLKYDPAVTTLIYYSIGTFFTIIICAIYSSHFVMNDFIFYGHNLSWIAVGYASIFATLFAYNATSWSNKRLKPSVTTVYNTLQPFGTVLLSFLFLSTIPSGAELIGGFVIALGLVVTVHDRCDDDDQERRLDSEEAYQDYMPVFTTAILSPEESSGNSLITTDIEYSQLKEENNTPTLTEKDEENERWDEIGGEEGIQNRRKKPTTPTATPVDTPGGGKCLSPWP